jgi:hypothetical protein
MPLASSLNAHPIVKVIDLLKNLKEQAIEEGKSEEVAFSKFQYWCETSTAELSKTIKEEKETIDSLESQIEGLKKEKKALEDQISELEKELTNLDEEQKAADTKDEKRTKSYEDVKSDLTNTIKSIGDAITALEGAGEKTSLVQQKKAQDSISQAFAFLAMKTTDEQRGLLADFVGADPKVMGDRKAHVKPYKFKSDNVIDLLKELQLKFEDDLTTADTEETAGANSYSLEKNARTSAIDASKKSKDQKTENLADTESSLSSAEGDLKNEEADLEADSKGFKDTKEMCETRTGEWEERSKTRAGEIAAIGEGIKILAKVSGVRTEAPSNPVLPSSPVDFLQTRQIVDPKAQAVNLLRQTAKIAHSKALERLALEVSTHLTGPFDNVNDMIQKMVLRLMAEQADEDKHKAWCDLELEKTDKSKTAKEDKIKDLVATIEANKAKVQKLTLDITDADKMVADITDFMKESTEIRQTGKKENAISIKEAKQAQTAIANAVSVLEDFYKESGEVPKESFEFLQTDAPGKVKLPEDPKLWDSSYTGVADPKKASTGVLTILEEVAADFSRMEADTKAQEVEDQKEYDETMKAHKIEKDRRSQESDAKVQEKKRMISKTQELEKSKKHTNDELDAVKQYSKDLQPACVDGDSSYDDRKTARGKEIKALKDAQKMLKDAFKEGGKFLQIKRHA